MKTLVGSTTIALGLFSSLGQTAFSQTSGNMGMERQAGQSGMDAESIGIGARIGLVNVQNLDESVTSFGIFSEYGLSQQFLAGLSLDYWNETSGVLVENPVEVSNFSVGAHGRWVFTDLGIPVQPYALAGVAVHRIRISLSERIDGDELALARFTQTYEDREVKFGIDIGGGASYAVDQHIDILGEVRHRNLLDDKIRFDQWAFLGGIMYRL